MLHMHNAYVGIMPMITLCMLSVAVLLWYHTNNYCYFDDNIVYKFVVVDPMQVVL